MIDAHHHFWRFDAAEHPWITDAMPALRRNFTPDDLLAEMQAAGVVGAISVQARSSLEETNFLLDYAERRDFLLGVVGWVDLKSPAVGDILDQYVAQPKFKGVREICQGDPNSLFFENAAFHAGIRSLTKRRLTYDLLIYANQLLAATAFVDCHPDQQFILDHCAKPEIRGQAPPPEWRRQLGELSRRPHVACKLSGLATEVREPADGFNPSLLHPYFESALEFFGPDRLMIGSDWPVLNLRASYEQWMTAVNGWLAHYPLTVRNAVTSETARRLYGCA